MLSRPAAAVIAAVALVLSGSAVTAAPAAQAAPTPVTVADLRDTSASQQRWLSVPDSRVVLNPYNFDSSGSELAQSSGADLPLSNGYYAHDQAIRTAGVLSTYADAPSAPATVGYSEDFDALDGWTGKDVNTPVVEDGTVTISPTKTDVNSSWGSIYSPAITLDLSTYSKVTVKVPATSPAGVGLWSLKVNMNDGGNDLEGGVKLMDDTSATGEFTYDLAAFMASYGYTGVQTFRLRLWTSNWNTGVSQVSSTFDSISVHQPEAGSFPDAGQLVSWSDDFDSAAAWTPGSGMTVSAAGGQGTVTRTSDQFGYASASLTAVDLSRTPIVSVKVTSGTGKWALKVNDGSGDVTLQPDVSATGTFSYDLRSLTSWTGTKSFTLKLYQNGDSTAGTSTTYDRISVHSGGVASRSAATSVDYAWTPAALAMTGTFPGGTASTEEFFTADDPNAYTRVVTSNLDSDVLVGGVAEKTPTYDAATRTITVPGTWATRSITLPASATVTFYPTKAGFLAGFGGTSAPTSSTTYWAAAMPGQGTYAVGVGWAVNTGQNNPGTALAASQASARGAAAPSDVDTDRSHWVDFWDAYLAKAPAVQDFSIQRVATGGVTAEQMKHFYYQAWVGLEMNVLPATPETGNDYAQLGTGKPSMWMNGTPGTKNVASWDSLLGMQQLVYTDPENAWASFQGMMALVNDEPGATEPSDAAYGTRGELGGESLPSRKAQTAWILYQVTGDEARLASIYDKLKLHLNWERYNLRWVLGGHNFLDERDAEFVSSLIYDLKYAIDIANELGHPADATMWQGWIPDLTQKYQDWFFPTTADGNGKVWPTVQKVYLDASRTTSPSGEATEGAWYRNENGQIVEPGYSFYTSPAFVMDQLAPQYQAKIMQRFTDNYDENKQLAGLGAFAVKAPDVQLLTYGLLDKGGADDAANLDKATVVINSITRDTVISGWFAEVYQQTGNGTIGDPIIARGVRPSLFGLSNYLDNVFMANGVRIDDGVPAFLRLQGATGGVSGLTFRGKSYDVDLDGTTARLSGAAVDAGLLPATLDVSQAGKSVRPEVTVPEHDAALATLTVDGTSVVGFDAATTSYPVTLPAGATGVPVVAATARQSGAEVAVTQAAAVPGTATVKVTAPDGTTVRTYTVAFTRQAPSVVASTTSAPPVVTAVYGSTLAVPVTVVAGGRAAAGTVRVTEGSRTLATVTLDASGRATVKVSGLAAGAHRLTVAFVPRAGSGVAPSQATVTATVARARATLSKGKVVKGAYSHSKKGKKAVRAGRKAVVKITVKVAGDVSVGGTVKLKAKKKVLGKAKVKHVKGSWLAKVKIAKKASKKIRKTTAIKAVYSGTSDVTAAKKKTGLKVRR